jgi:hypothetical protein
VGKVATTAPTPPTAVGAVAKADAGAPPSGLKAPTAVGKTGNAPVALPHP